jgi:hypothetical protein
VWRRRDGRQARRAPPRGEPSALTTVLALISVGAMLFVFWANWIPQHPANNLFPPLVAPYDVLPYEGDFSSRCFRPDTPGHGPAGWALMAVQECRDCLRVTGVGLPGSGGPGGRLPRVVRR